MSDLFDLIAAYLPTLGIGYATGGSVLHFDITGHEFKTQASVNNIHLDSVDWLEKDNKLRFADLIPFAYLDYDPSLPT